MLIDFKTVGELGWKLVYHHRLLTLFIFKVLFDLDEDVLYRLAISRWVFFCVCVCAWVPLMWFLPLVSSDRSVEVEEGRFSSPEGFFNVDLWEMDYPSRALTSSVRSWAYIPMEAMSEVQSDDCLTELFGTSGWAINTALHSCSGWGLTLSYRAVRGEALTLSYRAVLHLGVSH